MILNSALTIDSNENAGHLHDRLMYLGSETVIKTLALIAEEKVNLTIQTENPDIKTAYKLNKENCKIDWTQSATTIHNLIRGLSPYPTAWCYFSDKTEEWSVKIYEACLLLESHNIEIGTIVSTKKELKIAVKDGFIQVLSLQFPGKKRMLTPELLNGLTFTADAKAY